MTRSVTLAALALLATPVLAQPSVQGTWDAPIEYQIDGVHSSLFPDGSLVFLGHTESPSGFVLSQHFTPGQPVSSASYPTARNYFCGVGVQLPDGTLLMAGGEAPNGDLASQESGVFDPTTGTWTQKAQMKRPRWYPSALLLGDGTVWVFGGQNEAAVEASNDPTIEWYDPATDTWTLAGGQGIPGQFEEAYNRVHLMPDGRVFNSGHLPQTHLYDPVTRTWAFVDTTNLNKPRGDGGSVRLQDGRILIVGGQDLVSYFKSAEVIDLAAPNPQWQTVAPMKTARAFLNTILLPDGNVLVVGGDEAAGSRRFTPELYDPVANTWTDMATIQHQRPYHATAHLLPDGRVLIAGGEGNNGPGLYEEADEIEIWNPYYLFKTPRPVITSLPASAGYGQSLSMGFQSSVGASHVVFAKSGSATHAFTYNQISVPVSFDSQGAGTASFTVPNNPNLLPPGFYMVFLMSTDGVPSVAEWVQVGDQGPIGSWTDLGNGLAGSQGLPQLTGSGPLTGGSTVSLQLGNAPASATSFLIVGLSPVYLPLKGGVLVPAFDFSFALPTNGAGQLTVNATWPSGLPAGFSTWYQSWIQDPQGLAGFAASNGLLGTTP